MWTLKKLFAATFALLVMALPVRAEASDHYAVILNLSHSPHQSADLEVASDFPGVVTFRVGAVVTSTVSIGPPACYAASGNLFSASGGTTALVSASLPVGSSTAVLRQTSTAGKILVNIPPFDPAHGRKFSFPLGDIGQGAYLLIGNPNGTQANLTLSLGSSVAQPTALTPVSEWGTLVVPLTTSNTQVWVFSDVPVVAMLAVDTGKIDETWIPPVD